MSLVNGMEIHSIPYGIFTYIWMIFMVNVGEYTWMAWGMTKKTSETFCLQEWSNKPEPPKKDA